MTLHKKMIVMPKTLFFIDNTKSKYPTFCIIAFNVPTTQQFYV